MHSKMQVFAERHLHEAMQALFPNINILYMSAENNHYAYVKKHAFHTKKKPEQILIDHCSSAW
jgi:hypothetical protein